MYIMESVPRCRDIPHLIVIQGVPAGRARGGRLAILLEVDAGTACHPRLCTHRLIFEALELRLDDRGQTEHRCAHRQVLQERGRRA